VRRRDGEEWKKCAECGEHKPRYSAFAPRWGRCPRHAGQAGGDASCTVCRSRRNGRCRQPRCHVCDAARGRRKSVLRALERAAVEAGLPGDAVRAADASVRTVCVFELCRADQPVELLARLRAMAGGAVRIDVDPFRSPLREADCIQPIFVEAPSARARSYAPVLDAVALGGGFSPLNTSEGTGYFDTGGPTRKGDFVLRVAGRSMEPLIRHGSWCLFRPDSGDHLCGQVVLAERVEDCDPDGMGRLTVKRLVRRSDRLYLVPLNPDYEPIPVERDGGVVRIVARSVRVLRVAG